MKIKSIRLPKPRIKLSMDCSSSCKPNPGNGYIDCILFDHKDKELRKRSMVFKGLYNNNHIELQSLLMGLICIWVYVNKRKNLEDRFKVRIYVDSKYVCDNVNWKLKPWIDTDFNGGQVKNKDIWNEINILLDKLRGNQHVIEVNYYTKTNF